MESFKVNLMEHDERRFEYILRRMGEPSWLILKALDPFRPSTGVEITQRVEDFLRRAKYPYTRLDASTLHYALERMEHDRLVRRLEPRVVEVPGRGGSIRRVRRPVYVITDFGGAALEHHDRLRAATSQLRVVFHESG